MTFERPWALGFLLLVPLLFLLGRLLQARRRREVATFVILERALARVPVQRGRGSRPLDLLRYVPLGLALVAIAGPTVTRSAAPKTIWIVDRSASMGRRVEGRTRLQRALEALETAAPSPSRRVGVPEPADASEFTTTVASAVERELSERTLELAGSEDAQVWLATDDPPTALPDTLGLVTLGGGGPNWGLTAVGVNPEGQLLVRVDGDEPTLPGRALVVHVGETERARVPIERVPFRFESGPFGQTVPLSVRIDPGGADSDPVDDQVTLLPTEAAMLVLLPASGVDALARGFEANPAVTVVRSSGGVSGESALSVVLGGAFEDGIPGARLLVAPDRLGSLEFGTPSARTAPAEGRAPFDRLGIISAPALRAPRTAPGSDSEVLVSLGAAPLLFVRGETYVLTQDPELAPTWITRPSFPLLLAALVEHRLGAAARLRCFRGGEVLDVPSWGNSTARWRRPSGAESMLTASSEGRFRTRLDLPGIHVLEGSETGRRYAVSALDARETGHRGAATACAVQPPRRPIAPGSASLRLDRWLVIVAALALLGPCALRSVREGWRRWRMRSVKSAARPPVGP